VRTKERDRAVEASDGGAAPAVGPVVREWLEKGSGYAGPRLDQAKEWAAPRIEQARDRGVELAAPRIEAAATRLAPAIDATRDLLVDDVLPKVSAAAAAAAARVEESRKAAERARRRAERRARAQRRRRGWAVVFWIVSLAGLAAAVMVLLNRRRTATDPWAQPYPGYPVSPGTGGGEDQQPETDLGSGPNGGGEPEEHRP
jgi:hypothetical protein